MKNLFLPTLLMAVLFLSAGFGLATMSHINGQGHSNCPFENAGIVSCSQFQNLQVFTILHLNAISVFFSVIPASGFLAVFLMLVFLSTLATFHIPGRRLGLAEPEPLFIRNCRRESFISPHQVLFAEWLGFHENSPAFII